MVEQRTRNAQVSGPNPDAGSTQSVNSNPGQNGRGFLFGLPEDHRRESMGETAGKPPAGVDGESVGGVNWKSIGKTVGRPPMEADWESVGESIVNTIKSRPNFLDLV